MCQVENTVNPTDGSGVLRLIDFERQIPDPDRNRAVLALKRGTLDLKLSLPIPPNVQTPHEQDELYFVVRGSGTLVVGEKRERFEAGDVLFVAAGVVHHYEDFSNELALWRVFYGAIGGEIPDSGKGEGGT